MIKQVKIKKREQIESKQNHDECVPMKYSRSKWNAKHKLYEEETKAYDEANPY